MTARLGAFSWQWATVRKIKSYVSYRARTVLEPAGEWVPRPYPSPGHTSYCGTRLTRRTVAGHILEQPPRRWAHQARSLGPSLPSTSLDPLSRPQSRFPAASHPIHCPPRSPLPARPDPLPPPASHPIHCPPDRLSRPASHPIHRPPRSVPPARPFPRPASHPIHCGPQSAEDGVVEASELPARCSRRVLPRTPFTARLDRLSRPGPIRCRRPLRTPFTARLIASPGPPLTPFTARLDRLSRPGQTVPAARLAPHSLPARSPLP
jgi:hypothetical protein